MLSVYSKNERICLTVAILLEGTVNLCLQVVMIIPNEAIVLCVSVSYNLCPERILVRG